MRAVMVMFDTLDKNYLQAYGCEWTKTPNFLRLAEKTLKFNHFYVGSMPCIPARREIHTGRYGFLHRGWGPLEPFDNSMPEILKNSGVYTHLSTDHVHYIEDGGATYHNRYSSYEIFRGQEGDRWKAVIGEIPMPELDKSMQLRKETSYNRIKQDFINRSYMKNESDMPQAKTFQAGLDFIDVNHKQDNWFLQIETFDPHEPFFTQDHRKKLYPETYHGLFFDWPAYKIVEEDENKINHVRNEYASLISMCDDYLGKVLDAFDKYNLWEDTLLIVNTDHGVLLGEHDWWGKISPMYNEIANVPFFIYDPRYQLTGECDSLVQTIDIAPTLLEFFNIDIPKEMMGKPLKNAYFDQTPLRTHALYGKHGTTINITDKRYTYFKAPLKDGPKYCPEYTLMPMNVNTMFSPNSFKDVTLSKPFDFTKGSKLMRVVQQDRPVINTPSFDMLFDLELDPHQLNNIRDGYSVKADLTNALVKIMRSVDAPIEQYERMGLDKFLSSICSAEDLRKQDKMKQSLFLEFPYTHLTKAAQAYFLQIIKNTTPTLGDELTCKLKQYVKTHITSKVTMDDIDAFLLKQTEVGESIVLKAKAYKAYFKILLDKT